MRRYDEEEPLPRMSYADFARTSAPSQAQREFLREATQQSWDGVSESLLAFCSELPENSAQAREKEALELKSAERLAQDAEKRVEKALAKFCSRRELMTTYKKRLAMATGKFAVDYAQEGPEVQRHGADDDP